MSQNENILSEGSRLPMSSIEFGITPDTSCADYWQVRLADVSVLELPTDRQRPAILGQRMELESSCLPDNLNSGMRRIGADAGVEVSTVTLGVFAVMLHRYTAQEKFAVGVVLGSRLLPITVDFSGRPSFRNLLQRMEAATSTGSTVGGVPAELSAKLGRDADRSRHPIYQAGFSAERNGAPLRRSKLPVLTSPFS